VGKKEPSYSVGIWISTPPWKTVQKLLKKLKIELLYDPAIPLWVIYTKECKSGYKKDTCTPIFITALFTIAELWKQSRWPITDEWI
jgi:hypothetical protein